MNSTNLRIIADLAVYLQELEEEKTYFTKKTDFTRKSIFTFLTLYCLITNLPRKSLDLELWNELKRINSLLGLKKSGTKSAFGKARKKIKWELFEAVSKRLITKYYSTSNSSNLIRWNNFLLRGIDGSIFDIVDTTANREYFGEGGNDQKKVCQARCMISYDPLNGLIDKAYLGHMDIGENTIAKKWVKERTKEELSIYDRGFTGSALQYMHDYYGTSYVIRSKLGHSNDVKAFVASGEIDSIQEWDLTPAVRKDLANQGIETTGKTTFKVRLLRIELDTGETEVLVTNLLDQEAFPHELFKELYFLRWPTETTFGFLKNTLCVELTSGYSPISIMQDFWGTIIRANVQALIEEDAAPIVDEKSKDRKWDYKVNRSFAAGALKALWAPLWLCKQKRRPYLKAVELFSTKIEPVRKDRKYIRIIKTFRRNRGKFTPIKNYKRTA